MSARSPEGKAARRVKDAISTLDLDPSVFAYIFVDNNPVIQQRMFDIVIALIEAWATEYASKGIVEDYARDAMRLRDTIDTFQINSHK